MSQQPPPTEFLVISRGQWDTNLSRNEKQNVIEQFYAWLDQLVDQGKMKRGQRLTYDGKTIGRKSAITDGPFGESKEVIGGYWFILAQNLDEAAQIAKAACFAAATIVAGSFKSSLTAIISLQFSPARSLSGAVSRAAA
jgi:hypothetical protein